MKKVTQILAPSAHLEAPALRRAVGQVAADANPPAPTQPAPATGVLSVTGSNIDTALQLGPR